MAGKVSGQAVWGTVSGRVPAGGDRMADRVGADVGPGAGLSPPTPHSIPGFLSPPFLNICLLTSLASSRSLLDPSLPLCPLPLNPSSYSIAFSVPPSISRLLLHLPRCSLLRPLAPVPLRPSFPSLFTSSLPDSSLFPGYNCKQLCLQSNQLSTFGESALLDLCQRPKVEIIGGDMQKRCNN